MTPQDVRVYAGSLVALAQGDPRTEDLYRRFADEMIFPDTHPAHGRIMIDPVQVLWVERTRTEPPWQLMPGFNPVPATEAQWDLFASDGVWLGTVSTPPRFRVMDIGRNYIAGVAKDSLDVETIAVWELRRPGL